MGGKYWHVIHKIKVGGFLYSGQNNLTFGGQVLKFWIKVKIVVFYIVVLSYSSLKTAENLQVIAKIPNDRLMLETDCPWCEVRPTHAGAKFIKTTYPTVKKEKWQPSSMVKGRNEPANIV